MRRGPRAFALLALCSGCGDYERIWASVLVNTPLIYLAGLAVVYSLYEPWSRALPSLRFGRVGHWATLAALTALAIWAAPGVRLDGLPAIWGWFGGATMTLWLLALRIGLVWPKCQPFTWSGPLAFAASASPAVAGLASPNFSEYGKAGVFLWIFGSGMGLTFFVILAVLVWEARRLSRSAGPVDPAPPIEP